MHQCWAVRHKRSVPVTGGQKGLQRWAQLPRSPRTEIHAQSWLWRNTSWRESRESPTQCLELDRWTRLSSTQQRWERHETGREGASPSLPLLRWAQGPLTHSSHQVTLMPLGLFANLSLLSSRSVSQDTLCLGAWEWTVFAHQFVLRPCQSLLAVLLCPLLYSVPSQTQGETNGRPQFPPEDCFYTSAPKWYWHPGLAISLHMAKGFVHT